MNRLISRVLFAIRHRTLRRKVLADSRLLVYHRGETVPMKLRCPHQGAPLVDGYFDDDCLVCPWHGCRFSLSRGGAPEKSGNRVHY